MNSIRNLNISIDKIEYYSNYSVFYSKNNKYLIKEKNKTEFENIKYLDKIECNNYLPIYKQIEEYNIYLYPNDLISNRKKLEHLVITLIEIHKNSLEVYDYLKEEVEGFYNTKVKELDEVMKYYLSLQDHIEEMEYIREDYYELLINMSKIYRILSISRKYLEEWYYSEKKHNEVFLIREVLLDNFIYNDKGYFIDLKSCIRGNIIDDFVTLYRNYYDYNFSYLFELYIDKMNLKMYDLKLFFSEISKIEKLELTNDSSINIKVIKELMSCIENTIEFILEEDKKYQETDKEIFEKENKDIEFGSYEK